jgi:hypothetical protein
MPNSQKTIFRRFTALSSVGVLAAGCLDRPVAPADPHTTNIFVEAVPQDGIDKIDLLFMIDNSLSMKDKQRILEDAVPVLVQRLVTPRCLDERKNSVGMADISGVCTTGTPEFKPVKDIHIGVITSSLGSHGGEQCSPMPNDATVGRTPDDRAELLPLMRPGAGLSSWNGSGFLAWDPGQDKNVPPGESNITALVDNVRAQVQASGEIGCGFESSLEAWYRFLVDPEPPVSVSNVNNRNAKGPINDALLAQRAAFMRPDSLLTIVMLTDENDCSIDDDDGRQGFFISSPNFRLPRASAACAANPNDACCHTCAVKAPEGCTPNDADAECSKKQASESFAALSVNEDKPNLRCFDNKRRFGLDFLYPTQRYIDALTKPTVKNRALEDVPNPIFKSPTGFPRPKSQVLLAGIVGVPWQDIATEASREGQNLEYLRAGALSSAGRWDVILGDPATNRPPSDPHMQESVAPRTGTNPLLGTPIAPATSQNPKENPINGHEQNVPGFDDLQYACTFELPTPRNCDASNGDSCDCNANEQANNRPLCSYPNGPNTDGVQVYAKAYPGLRHLEVLKGVGENAIVASICPKNTQPAAGLRPETDPSYGYNPAVASILEIFREKLGSPCLPRKLDIETNPSSDRFGQVSCNVIEAVPNNGGECTCDESKGRSPVQSADLRAGAKDGLRENAQCGGDSGVDCSSYCFCEVKQLTGGDGETCQSGATNPNLYGYCYIDAEEGIGNPDLVASCEANKQRALHWTGEGLPAKGSTMLMACLGSTTF